MLTPAERVIARFGGQSALAALLGRRQSTVEHWASTGRIPSQWHQPLMSLARQRGVILEAKDFVMSQPHDIAPATGKLGVLLVGLGAVASTFVAGVEHARRGTGRPVGSLTQMGREPHAADQGLCAAGRPGRHRLRRLGSIRR
jgi:myo-inositol-1-phosphate synthase